MKIIISNAIWGEDYCAIFTKFSLATLLSPRNLPELARSAKITFHVVTTMADRERLSISVQFAELARYCEIKWDLIEDFSNDEPPTGPGGQKYSYLSTLQNLAITQSVRHDFIVFNYADFIWSDGSLTSAIRQLADKPGADAVLSFCVPVDRDSALPDLDRYRLVDVPEVIDLPPRDGGRIVIDRMHREARRRFWDAPGFTVTPTYVIWKAGRRGIVVRAYHQSVIAMRVRRDDPVYLRGITRGSLDANFSAQLAKTGSVIFANDTDRVLVFSLYDTPVNSQMPVGMTREISLGRMLQGDVLPEQRSFAQYPFLFGDRERAPVHWQRAIKSSWALLQKAEDANDFDPGLYDANLKTHGAVPPLQPPSVLYRNVIGPLVRWLRKRRAYRLIAGSAERIARRATRIAHVLVHPPLLRAAMTWRIARLRRICYVLWHPGLLLAAVDRRWENFSRRPAVARRIKQWRRQHPELKRKLERFRRRFGFYIVPGMWISRSVEKRFGTAIAIEGTLSNTIDPVQFRKAVTAAEKALRKSIARAPLWADLWRALGRNLWFQGRFDEAMRAWTSAEKLRDEMAQQAGWPIDSCIVLPQNCVESIGLMGHLDGFAKYKILSGDARPYHLIAPPAAVINSAFLSYWENHFEIASSPADVGRVSRIGRVYGVNWNWIFPKGDEFVFVHSGLAATQRAWERSGRTPLLTLKRSHQSVVDKARRRWGIKKHEQFVCLHVRSEGFYGPNTESAQKFRNTRIENYYPLIQFLTEQGYWVVRMGDQSMPPLDLERCGDSGRMVDYAVSTDKSAELDVALCATCALFVSSPSGLHTVAHAFGRPVCEVNYPVYNGFPWHSDDIFIPQLYFSRAKGRVLTLTEIMSSDVVHLNHQFLLDRAGISLVPNEPEDIVEVVREALAPTTYRVSDEASAEAVSAEFDALNRKYDVGISGRLGRHFAAKYATQLLHGVENRIRSARPTSGRKLDFLVPCFNRPRFLHHILRTGLAADVPGAYFVVLDDASDEPEDVPGLGYVTTEHVCRSFNDPRVIYSPNPTNMGVAATLERYYREVCDAEYTSLLNPKDEFVDGLPIVEGLAKLEADPAISFVVYPLRQVDREEDDRSLLFHYKRMSGREFISAHIHNSALQHCSGYAIIRVSALRKVGIPRSLGLRALGLEDASGIDHEMIYNLATTGDVEFVDVAPIRRKIVGGYTEQYPLTFAYTQYQYARRLMAELEPRGYVSAADRRTYLSFWHMIISRGLLVVHRPVPGTVERGVKRIKGHLKLPILVYLPLECLRFRVPPRRETVRNYIAVLKMVLPDRIKSMRRTLRIA